MLHKFLLSFSLRLSSIHKSQATMSNTAWPLKEGISFLIARVFLQSCSLKPSIPLHYLGLQLYILTGLLNYGE